MPHRKTLKNLFLEANRPPSISQPIGKTCSPLGQEVWSLLLNDRKGAGRAAPGAKAEWPRRVGLSHSAEVSGPSQTGGQRAFASGLLHMLRSCPCKGSIAVPPDRSARSGRLNFAPVHIDLPTVDVAAHTQKA